MKIMLHRMAQDIRIYSGPGVISLWKVALLSEPFHILVAHRLANCLYRFGFLFGALVVYRFSRLIYRHIDISWNADIGGGFALVHYGVGAVIGRCTIGEGCKVYQGVTIGHKGIGDLESVPRLGDRVVVGANSCLIGGIEIGDDCVVGTMTLVNRSFEPSTVIVGVPGRSLRSSGDSGTE